MSRRHAIVASAAGLLLAVPCAAKATDYASDRAKRADGIVALGDFARCAADENPAIADAYIRLPLDGRLADNQWSALSDKRCLLLNRGWLRMSALYFRAALAERLIGRNDMAVSREQLAPQMPLSWVSHDASASSSRDAYVPQLAECVVRVDPVAVRRVFDTGMASKDEFAAMQPLSDALMSCVPAGEKAAVNRTNLRAGLAVAYYRLAVGAANGVAS